MTTGTPLPRYDPRGYFGSPSFSTSLMEPDAPAPSSPPPVPAGTHPCSFGTWTMPPGTDSAPAVFGKDGFYINLDVQQFKKDEVSVKTVGSYVVIEARHEEQKDDNRILTRQMTRKYELPDDIDVERIECTLSPDGMLHVKVPKRPPPPPPDAEEKRIPIVICAPETEC